MNPRGLILALALSAVLWAGIIVILRALFALIHAIL